MAQNLLIATDYFNHWFSNLKDFRAKVYIDRRLSRIENGNFGDTRFVGSSVYEIKIDYGQGYRVYYTQMQSLIYILLIGGDKSTQTKDIAKAIQIRNEIISGEKSNG